MAMKESKMFNFLIKFGLSDLELVDIGTKIIKIGPEMPILGRLVTPSQGCTVHSNENETNPRVLYNKNARLRGVQKLQLWHG